MAFSEYHVVAKRALLCLRGQRREKQPSLFHQFARGALGMAAWCGVPS